jgi:peptide/nickel transport system permease protein
VLRPVLRAIVTLWIAVTIAFVLARAVGDPAAQLAGDASSPKLLAQIRSQLGLDRSLLSQYTSFLGHLVRGDLGTSFSYRMPNTTLIWSRLPASLSLAAGAMLVAILVGVPLGVLAAAREGRIADRIVSFGAVVGQSVPLYWVGLMGIVVVSVGWGLLPAGGNVGWKSYIMPVLTVSTVPLAFIARLTRASMSDAMQGDFFVAGLARGLSRPRMIWQHSLRHTLLPVLTVIGLQTGLLLSGSVTAEIVFSWPGMGRLITDGVQRRDFPLVQAIVVVGALVFVVVNLAVDLLYPIVDPRLRRSHT